MSAQMATVAVGHVTHLCSTSSFVSSLEALHKCQLDNLCQRHETYLTNVSTKLTTAQGNILRRTHRRDDVANVAHHCESSHPLRIIKLVSSRMMGPTSCLNP